jgi:NYN domain
VVRFPNIDSFFVRDGWEVIDTPPLTNRGKTSADIHIVIDVMDAIQQFSHIDEYVIMAADADFTPLVIRLRKYMKRTVVYASKSTSAAYRQACDAQIEEADLLELFDEQEDDTPEPTGSIPRVVNVRPVRSEPSKIEIVTPRVGGKTPITIERISSLIARYYIESGDGYDEAVPVLANLLKAEFGPEIMETWAGCGSISQLLKRAGCVVEKNAEGRTFARLPGAQRVQLPPNI